MTSTTGTSCSSSSNVFNRNGSNVYAVQRSELLDDRTCNICLSMDGRVFNPHDEITNTEHFCKHCRGIWVWILKDEVNPPKIEGIPEELRKNILDAKKAFEDIPEPIVKNGSLAQIFLNKKNLSRELKSHIS